MKITGELSWIWFLVWARYWAMLLSWVWRSAIRLSKVPLIRPMVVRQEPSCFWLSTRHIVSDSASYPQYTKRVVFGATWPSLHRPETFVSCLNCLICYSKIQLFGLSVSTSPNLPLIVVIKVGDRRRSDVAILETLCDSEIDRTRIALRSLESCDGEEALVLSCASVGL